MKSKPSAGCLGWGEEAGVSAAFRGKDKAGKGERRQEAEREEVEVTLEGFTP